MKEQQVKPQYENPYHCTTQFSINYNAKPLSSLIYLLEGMELIANAARDSDNQPF